MRYIVTHHLCAAILVVSVGILALPALAGDISVAEATYGKNCGARVGNVTSHIKRQCDGNATCRYTIDYKVIGDPVYGCAKDYQVSYSCGDGTFREATAAAEAGFRSSVALNCLGVAGGSSGKYRSRWDKIGGAGGGWTTGWVPGHPAPVCGHGAPPCTWCPGQQDACGEYSNGAVITVTPYGGRGDCSTKWQLRCTSESEYGASGGGIGVGSIRVSSATYGLNCGVASGNVTDHIAAQCNGRQSCNYTIDHKIIGDPAKGCAKDYRVTYSCSGGGTKSTTASKEAGWGDKSVALVCQ